MQFRRVFCCAAIAAMACLLNLNEASAQRGGGDSPEASKLQLLRNGDVQEEIGLLEDQKEGLRDFESKIRDKMRSVWSGAREEMAGKSREEREEFMMTMRERMTEEMKEVASDLEDILLPHQMERLDQLAMQSIIQRRGVAGAAESGALKELLGLSDAEAKKLKEKEEEVKKELAEKIKKLRAKAQDDILSVLPSAKQQKFKEMIGDSFEVTAESWRRGRGGDRGGRGGDRGGRGRGGDRGGRGDF